MRIPYAFRWLVLSLAVIAAGAWTQNPPPKTAPTAKATVTATQFYMAYRAALDKATKIEDLFTYLDSKTLDQIKATPVADRPAMFDIMKSVTAVNGLKVTKEGPPAANGTVVLTCTGTDPETKSARTGTVTIVKEGGAWKLSNEEWQ